MRFTLIELLLVVAIIAILAAMLLPVLTTARIRAKIPACQSNHHQQYIASQDFASDYNGVMPDHPQMIYRHEPGTIGASNGSQTGPGYAHATSWKNPITQLQTSQAANGLGSPIPIGMGSLYGDYIRDGRVYYCTDHTLYYREFTVGYRSTNWRWVSACFVDRNETVRLGVTGGVSAGMRYYYVRRTEGKRPEHFDAIPEPDVTPMLADRFVWDEQCERTTATMKFAHSNIGAVVTCISGNTFLHKRPTAPGPNYGTVFSQWTLHSSHTDGWGTDKGYWYGDKYHDPVLRGVNGGVNGGYDPNFKNGQHKMTAYDWWVFDN